MEVTLLEQWKQTGEAPEWLDELGYQTLTNGYLLKNETPKQMFERISKASAKHTGDNWKDYFDLFWKNWLCASTPVLCNLGTDRGLPISCLTGDSWINTKDGGKQMKDLQVGDLVLSHTGNWRKVSKKWSRMSTDDLYELKVTTRNTPIKITGNHPVLTNLGWVKVNDLIENKHLIATNKKITIEEIPYVIDLTSVCDYDYQVIDNIIKNKTKLNYSEPKAKIEVDEDIAWFLGIWFAEGSLSINNKKEPNGLRITLGLDETHFAERFLDIARKKFNINGNIKESKVIRNGKENGWINVNLNCGLLGKYFTNNFGKGCKNKNINNSIMNLPKLELESFLQGVLDGDGSLKKNRIILTLANPKLILSIYNIALKLEKPVSLQMQEKAGKLATTKYVYMLCFRRLNEISVSKNNSNSGIEFSDGLVYCPIDSLKKLNHNEEVFDIEVEQDHTFSVSGVVVHNCFGQYVEDSLDGIFTSIHETAMLTKHGGGIGKFYGHVRGRGKKIRNNGKSQGIIPWLKIEDSSIVSLSQGSSRRGSEAIYIDIDHPDIEEFLEIRKPTGGDVNRRCLNLHHAIGITDEFMESLETNKKNQKLWEKILEMRFTTGEPYLFFKDTANKLNPEMYNKYGLKVQSSQLCNEIMLHSSSTETYVCCLSSANLVRYDEWKSEVGFIRKCIRFLDGVLSEFIELAKKIIGFEKAFNFAQKHRALGLGVLGFHSLLQKRNLSFESLQAKLLNIEIFKKLKTQSLEASEELAKQFGEPFYCKGFGVRNTHLLAVAPTTSNSIISGDVSQGIEPWASNYFVQKSAKGTFIRKNKELEKLLTTLDKNTFEVWNSINQNNGSVQHLEFLSEQQKEVFKTAREINQHIIVKLASDRQKYICQGQSVNLFFTSNSSEKYVHEVHIEAWKQNLKGLYYLRSESVLKGDSVDYKSLDECTYCQ